MTQMFLILKFLAGDVFVLAPTLVLIGFGIQIYAILLNPDKK